MTVMTLLDVFDHFLCVDQEMVISHLNGSVDNTLHSISSMVSETVIYCWDACLAININNIN